MKATVARSADFDALYVDGQLVKEADIIDIADVILAVGVNKGSFGLDIRFIDDAWLRSVDWNYPKDEKDLVELDS